MAFPVNIFGKTLSFLPKISPFFQVCLTLCCLAFPLARQGLGQGLAEAMREAERMQAEMMSQGGARTARPNGGRSSARRGGPSNARPHDVYLTPMTSILSGIDIMPILTADVGTKIKSGPLLELEAKEAFQIGYQGLANELMYGHMVAEYEDAQGTITAAQYSPMFKRPTWSIRCGLSMAVRGADDLADFQPISESAKRSSGRGASSMQDRSMSQRVSASDFGPSAADLAAMAAAAGASGGRRSEAGLGDPRSSAMPAPKAMARPTMLSESAVDELQTHVGLVATVLSEQFDKHWKLRHFGSLFANVSEAIPEPQRGGRQTRRNAKMMSEKPLEGKLAEIIGELSKPTPMFRPGLIYLGQGASEEKLQDAAALNLDFLFHIDVTIKEATMGRKQVVQNISRVRLYNARTKKSLVASRGIDNQEAQQMLNSGRVDGTREYVIEQMAAVWRQIDNQAKAVKLPKLTPDVAKRRVTNLLSAAAGTPLRKMAEIRLYEALGLITAEEVEGAFYILGGYEGLVLLHGPLDDRREMARQFAVKVMSDFEENQ